MSSNSNFATASRGRGRGQQSYPRLQPTSRGFGRGSVNDLWQRSNQTSQWNTQAELVATITVGGLSPTQIRATISDVEYVASYNWLDQKTSTILVPGRFQMTGDIIFMLTIPGAPPAWAPPAETRRLSEDSGDVFRDQNAARYPKYPSEPAMRAVITMQPQFETKSIDVVGCGSTLGNLLRLVKSTEMSFRFDVEFIGNSVFFVRKENSPTELIPGLHGYGHTFPEAYTNWEADVKGSASHQRIVRYMFGGLRCLVRFESDGYLHERLIGPDEALAKAATDTPAPDTSATNKVATDIPTADYGSQISLLSQAADSVSVSQKLPNANDCLNIELGGRIIPQRAVFDLKTRTTRREIDMGDIFPRLWVSQTPNFIIGYHKAGHFEDIRVQDMHKEVRCWEEENEEALGLLNAVIRRIIEIARTSAGQKLEVSRIGNGPLLIRKNLDSEWHALPPDLRRRWALGQDIKEILPLPAAPSSLEGDSTPDTSTYGSLTQSPEKDHDSKPTPQHLSVSALQVISNIEPARGNDPDPSLRGREATAGTSGTQNPRSNPQDLGNDDLSDSGSDDEQNYSLHRGRSYDCESDKSSEKDYTACSAEDCGYCGRCEY